MTAVTLPSSPAPRSAVPRLLDFGADIVPPLGGAVQRLSRLGSRYRIDVEMPPMRSEPNGRQWVSRLAKGKTDRVVLEFPQPGLKIGAPGAAKVKTAVSGGTSVALKGLTPGYAIREGQFFSVIHNSRRYLYRVTAQAIANGSGDATVSIDPMLRTALSVNDVVELGKPMIEGFIEGDEVAWALAVEHFTGLSFAVVEAE